MIACNQYDQMAEEKIVKFTPKVATSDYIQIETLLKWPKKLQDFLAFIEREIVTKTLQK